jgi:hypothetical protein
VIKAAALPRETSLWILNTRRIWQLIKSHEQEYEAQLMFNGRFCKFTGGNLERKRGLGYPSAVGILDLVINPEIVRIAIIIVFTLFLIPFYFWDEPKCANL